MQVGMENSIQRKDWERAAANAGNLSELYLTSGDVPRAIDYARKAIGFSNKLNLFRKEVSRYQLGTALHYHGENIESYKIFSEAEKFHKKKDPNYPILHTIQGFQFCDLLFSQGKVKEVLERVKQTIEIAIENNWLLDIALDKLSLGRAYLLEALASPSVPPDKSGFRKLNLQRESTGGFEKAADFLNQAVTGLREAGSQDHLPRGLFARASLYRLQKYFTRTWEDLAEAQEIAERGEMKLWLVDYHLEAARLCLTEWKQKTGNRRLEEAEHHLTETERLIKETGYHRRDPEVEMGYASLFLAEGNKTKARTQLNKTKKTLDKMGIRMWDWEVQELEKRLGEK